MGAVQNLFKGTTLLVKGTTLLVKGTTLLFEGTTLLFEGTTLLFEGTALLFEGTALLFEGTALLYLKRLMAMMPPILHMSLNKVRPCLFVAIFLYELYRQLLELIILLGSPIRELKSPPINCITPNNW